MKPSSLIRSFGICCVLLLSCAAASGQAKSNSWLRGNWEGTGYQTDDKSTWEMALKVSGRRFAIDYPSLSCGGHWRLISLTATRARFREKLDHGQDKCADKGIVLIQRLNRNQLLFLWSYQGEQAWKASAILNRKR